MKNLFASALISCCALLAGCGTTALTRSDYRLATSDKVKIELATPPSASEEAVSIFRDRLNKQLSGSGLLATSSSNASKNVEVKVTNYNMRHGAARALAGIFAGTDNIQSAVKVTDSAGVVLNEFTVESKNASAWGTSRGLIEDHADKIVDILRGGKPS